MSDSSVKVSFLELYNEELTDLLANVPVPGAVPDPKDEPRRALRLLEDRAGVVVQGLEETIVKSAAGEFVLCAVCCDCWCCLAPAAAPFQTHTQKKTTQKKKSTPCSTAAPPSAAPPRLY